VNRAKEIVPCQMTETPPRTPVHWYRSAGGLQRRRVLHRRHSARAGHRGSSARHTTAAGASCLACIPGVRRELPDDRRCVARPHRIDRPACAVRSDNTGAERVAVTIYGLTLLTIRLLGSALDAYARHEHLYSPQGDGDKVQGPRRKLLPVVIGYVIAILIGLVLPEVAVALYCGIAVYLIVPFRQVARLLFRRS
jgi:hypothetical protein